MVTYSTWVIFSLLALGLPWATLSSMGCPFLSMLTMTLWGDGWEGLGVLDPAWPHPSAALRVPIHVIGPGAVAPGLADLTAQFCWGFWWTVSCGVWVDPATPASLDFKSERL